MAERVISPTESHGVSNSSKMSLASAAREWLLIFMLFIDAIFSYVVTTFARYYRLPVPCLLCSRLDHVLGNEKLGFCWDLMCGKHKSEISSMVLCHVHNKLVDVQGLCESCLFSFATINKSNSETYRLLVGKIGTDPLPELDLDPLLEDHEPGDLSTRDCSCCKKPYTLRSHRSKLFHMKSVGSGVDELDMPLSVATQYNSKDLRKGSPRDSHAGKTGFDNLFPMDYTKVKVTSDTESEPPFFDDEADGTALIRETLNIKEDFSLQCVQMDPCSITLADDLTSKKLIHLDSSPELSLLDSKVQLESFPATVAIGHGLDEFRWPRVEPNGDDSAASKFPSSDNVPQSANIMESLIGKSTACLDAREIVVEEKCCKEISEAGGQPVTISAIISEINPGPSDSNSLVPNNLDLGDAYKIAVDGKGRQLSGRHLEQRQLSGKLLEQISLKDSSRVSEDMKLLLSQISTTRGIELPLNDPSPKVSGNGGELKNDFSSSIGMHILQKRISLERNESGLSLDGSILSEIEGESEVDRLKRQVEHDKKLMAALYKELEEERNASAVAVNQAMAMITKLQEEKATFHMEALQCLRMMEEQAEYDVEALQKTNNLLEEKEKEVQDLEAELESYRVKFGDLSTLENEVESSSDIKAGEVRAEHSDAKSFENQGLTLIQRDEEVNAHSGNQGLSSLP